MERTRGVEEKREEENDTKCYHAAVGHAATQWIVMWPAAVMINCCQSGHLFMCVCVCCVSPGSFSSSLRPPETFFKVIFWLGYFNSCLNPIIYPCYSREFKQVTPSTCLAVSLKGNHFSPLCQTESKVFL